MTDVFGSIYANAYDVFYKDKDYGGECDLLQRIFQSYGDGAVRKVLDLGCGTGNHSLALARRGYEVVGVDRSPDMLVQAQKKLDDLSPDGRLVFREGDIRGVDLRQHFDACLMMFAVLGYQLENRDVLSALRTARRHLRPGGLFVFDVWYGPAVLQERPSDRIKVIPTLEGQILRAASGKLDTSRHVCVVSFRLWHIESGRLLAESKESHVMRYFFPLELEFFLESAGFAPVRLGAFPEFDRDPDEATWNVLGVARAK